VSVGLPYHYHKTVTQQLVKLGVDMIWLGDDVGGQQAMLMSPKMWRKYLKPRMADLIAALRALNPNIKIAYHTDGVVYPIISELIEIGIDVLNPIQPQAMDPARLKQEHGDRLCFWVRWTFSDDPVRHAGGREDEVIRACRRSGTAADCSSGRRTICSSTRRWRISGRW
jgi:hypothetical protein